MPTRSGHNHWGPCQWVSQGQHARTYSPCATFFNNSHRSCTSRFGRTSAEALTGEHSRSEASGWQTSPTKGSRASSTSTSWEMIVSSYNVSGRAGSRADCGLHDAAGWTDHARDLLYIINTLREQMPRPIVGVGHSLGGNIL